MSSLWVKDPTILLRKDKLIEIWPNSKMSSEDKVNAISRLIILMTLKMTKQKIGVF